MIASALLPGKPTSVLRTELLRHVPQYRKVLLFSVIANLLVLAPTFFMLEVYGRVVTSRSVSTLVMLLILVIGVYLVIELLENVRAAIMIRAGLQTDEALRNRLFHTAFEVTLRRGGGGSTQVFSDLKTVREFLASPALLAIMDAPATLVFLAIKFMIHPLLGALTLATALVQVMLAVRTEKRVLPALTEANRASIQAQGYANGTLRNAQVIEAMGMAGGIQKRWMTMQRKFLQLQAEASDSSGTNTAGGRFLQTMLSSMILGVSCWLHLRGGLNGGAGMMIVASVLGGRVLAPLIQLVAQWRGVVNARDAYARLDTVLEQVAEPPERMALPAPKGMLTVEGVVVSAPGSTVPILRGVAFGAKPGELVVVVGPSASGKTSLARALTGVWPSSGGKVRLDGVDVFAWNKEELGPHVGYLPQGVELFDGTIAENIARFGKVDADKVREAGELVGLGPMIDALPEGYDTRIGEDGAFLSGGQRQRVALARALYGSPRFVVLDEPNSSLDEAGELALVETLGKLKAAGCTIIVNSHRTSILPVSDRMLVLRDGQATHFGPTPQVLAELQKGAAAARQGQGALAAPAGRMGTPAQGGTAPGGQGQGAQGGTAPGAQGQGAQPPAPRPPKPRPPDAPPAGAQPWGAV